MELITKKLSELNPMEDNPRKMSKEEMNKLKNSIEKFGMVEPIVWNKRTGNVVGGHQRYWVLQEMNKQETEVVVVDINENEEKILNIALNKIHGEWDEEKLVEILKSIAKEN